MQSQKKPSAWKLRAAYATALALIVTSCIFLVQGRLWIALILGSLGGAAVWISTVLAKERFVNCVDTRVGRNNAPVQVPNPYAQDLTPDEVALFVKALVNPSEILSRIGQSVSPLSRAFKVRVVYTLEKPAEMAGNQAFFPLVISRKGTLHDDFHVRGADDGEMPTLSYRQYLKVVQAAMLSLMTVAGVGVDYENALRREVMNMIAGRAPISAQDVTEVDKLCLRMLGLRDSATNPDAVDVAVMVFIQLVYNYAILVPVRWETDEANELQVTVLTREERYIISLTHLSDRSKNLAHWVKRETSAGLGLAPTQFEFVLDEAHRGGSFHFEFMGPEGTYLARQEIDATKISPSAYSRFQSRLGQRYCHVYLRNFSTIDDTPPRVVLAFEERMPGSISAAFASAVAAAVLILVASLSNRLSIHLDGDVVAVLLAFPGAAAAWAGLERSTPLYGGSLAARLSTLVTSMMSLVAASAYLIGTGELGKVEKHVPTILSLVQSHGLWTWLTAIAVTNAAAVGVVWLHKATLHSFALRRPDKLRQVRQS